MKYAFFDLDGTLNGSKGRGDYIPKDVRDNSAWLRWHEAFQLEPLNTSLIQTAQQLFKAGFHIIVVSNRDTSLLSKTYHYLRGNGFPEHESVLRQPEDNRHPSGWKINTIENLMRTMREGSHVMHFDDDKGAQLKLLERFQYSGTVYTPIYINF